MKASGVLDAAVDVKIAALHTHGREARGHHQAADERFLQAGHHLLDLVRGQSLGMKNVDHAGVAAAASVVTLDAVIDHGAIGIDEGVVSLEHPLIRKIQISDVFEARGLVVGMASRSRLISG